MHSEEVKSILRNVREILKIVEYALNDPLTAKPDGAFYSMLNIANFGHFIISDLQRLKGSEPSSQPWYNKYAKEMENNPFMKLMYNNIPSKILKEAEFKITPSTHIEHLDTKDMSKLGPPPPYATDFFIGDQYGGSGWIVKLPDGREGKYYAKLPPEIGTSKPNFLNPLKTHLGKQLEDYTIQSICKLYVDYLRRMVTDAEERFGKD